MLLTAPIMSKGSFFGSLLNKCRQVTKILPSKSASNKNKNNNQNSANFTPISSIETQTSPPVTAATNHQNSLKSNRPSAITNLTLSYPAAGLKTIEEKVGLPPRPKKPLTPYFRFMKDMRTKVSAEYPKATSTDVVRIISKKWESADQKLKERLLEEYKRDQQNYVERRAKYDSKISDEQRAEIKQLKNDIAEAKERRMMRKRVKDLGRPKKPPSSFLSFLTKERSETPQLPKESFRDWHQKCTAKWKRLTAEEKEPYALEARKELEKFKKEMAIWEEKMIRLGNIDVVRQSNLIDPTDVKPKKH